MRSVPGVGLLALAFVAACSADHGSLRGSKTAGFRAAVARAPADPTVRPARLLPESIDEAAPTYGSEPDGGTRVIAAGLRIVASPKGVLTASEERFAQVPAHAIALPERLGSGWLFVVGKTVLRAESWLKTTTPVFTSTQPIQGIIAGLDRVYVRGLNAVIAIDGRTGKVLDLGPWPASPRVTSYAAADGWRAAAIADLRGAIATFDAGATWRSLDVAIDPKQVVLANDNIAIGGFEADGTESWFELRPDGALARLGAAPRDAARRQAFTLTEFAPPPPRRSVSSSSVSIPPSPRGTTPAKVATATATASTATSPETDDVEVKAFGRRPLAAAVEDGWPLGDGTAIIAREGMLARVSLDGGALVEVVRDAFPLAAARCHPVALGNRDGALGFVCGEPRGATVVYAYEPARGRLTEMRRFDKPRVVTTSGNGALAVRGPCAEDGEPSPPRSPDVVKLDPLKESPLGEEPRTRDPLQTFERPKPSASAPPVAPPPIAPASKPPPAPSVHPYCVFDAKGQWREIHVRGDSDIERVVVLGDGRTAVLTPPAALDGAARITVLDGGRATTTAVTFPRVSSDIARVLRLGFWLDGFEERRSGVIGGWIEAGGAMLGIEIALDGKATVGQFIRDAGLPFVSGRYGLGWTASHRGYETTDGGMTWTPVDLPAPLVASSKVERRACGPVGCLSSGWIRVGWGTQAPNGGAPSDAAQPNVVTSVSPPVPQVQLACEPMAGLPPTLAPPKAVPSPSAPTMRLGLGGVTPVLGSVDGLRDLPAFGSQAAPRLHDSERGLSTDIGELVDRFPRVPTIGRVYGWGPTTGDWDTLGHWQVKWLSPFAGWPEARATLATLPPALIVDSTRTPSASYAWRASKGSFSVAPGDDASHALLVGRSNVRPDVTLYEIEADRAPVEVRRLDGEPFADIEGAARMAGRWFVSTTAARTPTITTVWQIEGGIARELARVTRSFDGAQGRTKIAARSDGRAVGLVVDGEQAAERAAAVRWVLPIALESGAVGEPESLGYLDLAGRALEACGPDDGAGWEVDTAIAGSAVRVKLARTTGVLGSVLARLRLTSSRACIEALAGTIDGDANERRGDLARAGGAASKAPRTGELVVTAASGATRFPLRCTVLK